MTEESRPADSPEQPSKPQPRALYSKVSRAVLDLPGGRARKRRELRRARKSEQRLLGVAERHAVSVSLPDS